MDPLTQGTLGAAVVLATVSRSSPLGWKTMALLGALSGMAADLDILIRSADDPLLAIKYHRHFSHSLAFIPAGGLLCTLPLLLWRRLRAHPRWVLIACTVGYATHALLDACTSYGTLLLWPFSDTRVGWRIISVVDPLFTLPMLAAIIATLYRPSVRVARASLAWGALLLALGFVQQRRAVGVQAALAQSRGHELERSSVFVMFANNVSWRSIYQSGGHYYVDKIRVPPFAPGCVSPGTTVRVIGEPTDLAELPPKIARAERLIRWFSDGWVAANPNDPSVLGDLRYSLSAGDARPIWGVRTTPSDRPLSERDGVEWVNDNRKREVSWQRFRELVCEDSPDAICF
jgi:inner membrane protein